VTAADGSVTAYTYSGNTVTVTDPAGKWKTFTSDAFGNLTSVQEPNPDYQPSNPSYAPQYVYTIYTYDALNHLTIVAMTRVLPGPGNSPVTQNRSFVYDSNQRLWKATNPENGLVTYLYNNDGTLQSKTDAKGQQVTYSYNPGDMRVQAIDHLPAGANTSPDPCQHVALYWDVQLIPGGVSINMDG